MVVDYLKETYRPNAIIVYGSFSDGSANENSDFDALVISDHIRKHDSSMIGNIVLDVFVYPLEVFQQEFDAEEFVQIHDGRIILDKNGVAERLQRRVLEYIEHTPLKTENDIQQEIAWCEKMLSRTLRGDSEGYYRWHWLLFDSLEIYFDIKQLHYYGPKKALRYMEQTDTEAFCIYSAALKEFSWEGLSEWILFLKGLALGS